MSAPEPARSVPEAGRGAAPVGKAHEFDLVEIPESFGPREVLVDEARVKAFAFAQDDHCPWHFASSPFGGPVAHASILANELMQVYFERYRIDAHEHAGNERGAWLAEAHVEETMWFAAPLAVGDTAAVDGVFVDKYVRDGRGAVVLEGHARGADGRPIMGHRAVEYFRMSGPAADTQPAQPPAPFRRVGGADARAGAPARHARHGLAPGTPLETLRKTITFPQLLVFSTLEHPGAQRSVHNDFEIARRAGLRAPLVQGQQLACHVCESMTRFFGTAWYTSGLLRMKFLGAVCAGESIAVEARVHGELRRDGRALLELDVSVLSDAGTVVAVANAAAELPVQGAGDSP